VQFKIETLSLPPPGQHSLFPQATQSPSTYLLPLLQLEHFDAVVEVAEVHWEQGESKSRTLPNSHVSPSPHFTQLHPLTVCL